MANKRKPNVRCHGVDNNIEGLVLLINFGDCVFPYLLHPRGIADDPVATAENLTARNKLEH